MRNLSQLRLLQAEFDSQFKYVRGGPARSGCHLHDDREALELAKDAMTYSCERQNPDGAWFYGEIEIPLDRQFSYGLQPR